MTDQTPAGSATRRVERRVRMYLACAAAWSALLLVAGAVVLTDENGAGVVAVVSIPLVLVAALTLQVVVRARRGRGGPGALGWAIAILAGIFTLLGMLTIGIFVIPVTALMFVACDRLQHPPRAHPPSAASARPDSC
jgi:hypothetical protein